MVRLIAVIFLLPLLFTAALHAQDVETVFQSGHGAGINKIAFSSDSKFIASGSGENFIVIWELESGKQYAKLTGHTGAVNDLLFHPADNDVLISCAEDGTVIVWNYRSGSVIKKIRAGRALKAIAFANAADANILLAGGNGLVSIDLSKEKVDVLNEELIIRDLAPDNAGKALIALNEERTILFDISRRIAKDSWPEGIDDIVYSPNDKTYYGLTSSTGVKALAYKSDSTLRVSSYSEQGKKYGFMALALTADEIICAGAEQNIYFYQKRSFVSRFTYGHSGAIMGLAVNPSQDLVASSGADNTIIIWNLKTLKQQQVLKGHFEPLNAISFTSNGSGMITGGSNGSLKYWDLEANTFYSTAIPLSERKKRSGWSHAITGIDSANAEKAFIKYVQYTNVKGTDRILSVVHYNGVWDYLANTFTLRETSRKIEPASYVDMFSVPQRQSIKDIIIANREAGSTKKKDWSRMIEKAAAASDAQIAGWDYNSKYDFIASVAFDGTITFWKAGDEPSFLVNAALFGKNDFLFTDREGHYFGTKPAIEYMSVRYKNKLYPVSRLDAIYNRPDIILDHFPWYDDEMIRSISDAVISRKNKTLKGQDENAASLLASLPDVETEFRDAGKENVSVTARSKSSAAPLKKVVTRINGIVIEERALASAADTARFGLLLLPGANHIEVKGVDERGINTLPVVSVRNNPAKAKEEPVLYIIGIGASKYSDSRFNLNYAEKDVKDLMAALKESKRFSEVRTLSFFDRDITRANVLASAQQFTKDVRPEDAVIVFYAGHGVLDNKYNYFLATYDIDFNDPSVNGLAYEDLLLIADRTSSRSKICLIDACHSGELDKDEIEKDVVAMDHTQSGDLKFRSVGAGVKQKNGGGASAFELSKQLFNDQRENSGTIVISAAGGMEFAIESGEYGNGLFTYALLKGLKEKDADLDGDRKISVKELEMYLPLKVTELTKGKQRANTRTENRLLNFSLY